MKRVLSVVMTVLLISAVHASAMEPVKIGMITTLSGGGSALGIAVRDGFKLAIDQEGGKVARLKAPFTEFSGNPHMRSIEDATHFAEVTSRELTAAGINMNMAPVLDVALPGQEGIMRDRAFGDDPAWVAELGLAVIQHLQSKGIMAVAKHFPGHGDTDIDSHDRLPTIRHSRSRWWALDAPPFEAAIEAGAEDVVNEGDEFIITAEPTEFMAVQDAIKDAGIDVELRAYDCGHHVTPG